MEHIEEPIPKSTIYTTETPPGGPAGDQDYKPYWEVEGNGSDVVKEILNAKEEGIWPVLYVHGSGTPVCFNPDNIVCVQDGHS